MSHYGESLVGAGYYRLLHMNETLGQLEPSADATAPNATERARALQRAPHSSL